MKQKRYWLRGGLIGLVLGCILISIHFIFYKFFGVEAFNYFVIAGIFGIVIVDRFFHCDFLDMGWTNHHLPKYCNALEGVGLIISALFVYLVIGIIIGWFYGKFKNRNNI